MAAIKAMGKDMAKKMTRMGNSLGAQFLQLSMATCGQWTKFALGLLGLDDVVGLPSEIWIWKGSTGR